MAPRTFLCSSNGIHRKSRKGVRHACPGPVTYHPHQRGHASTVEWPRMGRTLQPQCRRDRREWLAHRRRHPRRHTDHYCSWERRPRWWVSGCLIDERHPQQHRRQRHPHRPRWNDHRRGSLRRTQRHRKLWAAERRRRRMAQICPIPRCEQRTAGRHDHRNCHSLHADHTPDSDPHPEPARCHHRRRRKRHSSTDRCCNGSIDSHCYPRITPQRNSTRAHADTQ